MNKNFSSKLKILAALNICWLSIANGQPAVGPATEDADFWLMMIPLIVKSASANQVPAPRHRYQLQLRQNVPTLS